MDRRSIRTEYTAQHKTEIMKCSRNNKHTKIIYKTKKVVIVYETRRAAARANQPILRPILFRRRVICSRASHFTRVSDTTFSINGKVTTPLHDSGVDRETNPRNTSSTFPFSSVYIFPSTKKVKEVSITKGKVFTFFLCRGYIHVYID